MLHESLFLLIGVGGNLPALVNVANLLLLLVASSTVQIDIEAQGFAHRRSILIKAQIEFTPPLTAKWNHILLFSPLTSGCITYLIVNFSPGRTSWPFVGSIIFMN